MSYRHLFPALLLLVAISAPAYAQQATPAAPAAPAKPEAKPEAKPAKPAAHKAESGKPAPIISTNYGDWALRCQQINKSSPRICEISQTIEAPNQSGPIAKISVGRPKASNSLHVVVILPTNISFPSSVHIRTSDKDKWGLELDWQRCIEGGCFADAVLSDATVVHWHGLDTIGSIIFTDAAGEELSLPMTFRGFGQALDALNK